MSKRLETVDFFLLRKVIFQESDLMLTLLSDDFGRLSARARGGRASKKRFGGRLSLFRKLRGVLEFDERFDVAEMKEVTVLKDFSHIEASFEKIAFASYATELTRVMLSEADAAHGPFALLESFYEDFSTIEDHPLVMELRLDRFIFELLTWWGRAPSVACCHRCGVESDKVDKYRFLRSGEGLICASCKRPSDPCGVVSPYAFYILHFLAGKAPSNPVQLADYEAVREVRRVLQASMSGVVTSDLKSYRILRTLLV